MRDRGAGLSVARVGEAARRARLWVRIHGTRAFLRVVRDARSLFGPGPLDAGPERLAGPLSTIALFPQMFRTVWRQETTRRFVARAHGVRALVLAAVTVLYALSLRFDRTPPAPPKVVPHTTEVTEVDVGPLHVKLPDGAHVTISREGDAGAPEAVTIPLREGEGEQGVTLHSKRTKAEALLARVREKLPWLGLVSRVYAFMVVAEWLLIALTRQYDDEIARRLALLVKVAPEDEPKIPKVSFDPKWALRKLRDRVRGAIVFASAFPLYVVVEATGTTRFVAPMVVALWGLYWSVVYSAAKSGHAWRDEPLGPLPFFLRPFEEGMAKHPRLFAYPRLLAWLMRPLGSPATHGERSFGAFLGLVAVRALTHVPFVYLWLRPFVAVAAARIVAGHDPRARLGGDVAPMDDTGAPTGTPDAPGSTNDVSPRIHS